MERKTLLQEVIDTLVSREGVSRKVAETFGHAFFEVIEEALQNDKFVKVKGFGTFKLVPVSERESVNVNTGERIQIGSHSKVTFTPDAYIRDLVNKPFSQFQTTVLNDDTTLDELEAADALVPEESEEAPAEETSVEEAPAETVDTIEKVDKVETVENPAPEETVEAPAAPTYQIEDDAVPAAPPAYQIDEAPEQQEEQLQEEQQQEEQQQEQQQEQEQPQEEQEEQEEQQAAPQDPVQEPQEEEQEQEQEAEESEASPTPRRRIKWWKLLVALLFILLLMAASYFAGYFRVLCPPCESTAPASEAKPTTPQAAPAQPAATPAPPATTPDTSKQAQPKAQPATDKAKQPETAKQTETAKPEKKTYNPKVRYEISGTRETYTVKPGEGVYRIAKKVYGHKEFASYIIKHNKLRDPDNIAVGAKLKIPELTQPTN